MHVVARLPRRIHGRANGRRMYSPRERGLVRNDMGLGEVDGLFNIGKMFTRMFTFTPGSFKLKNIMGAIGSATMFTASGGLSSLAPKITGAHSSVSKAVGYGTVAVAAAAGGAALLASAPALGVGTTAATGTGLTTVGTESTLMAAGTGVLAPVAETSSFTMAAGSGVLAPVAESGGILSTVGNVIGTVGSGLMSVVKGIASVLPTALQVLGGGQQQQYAQQGASPYGQQYGYQPQAAQTAMYTPTGYGYQDIPSMAYAQPASMNTSYGDLRSPYTAIAEDGSQVQVDPVTGQVIDQGISTPVLIGGGALVLLLGWYLLSDN